MGTRGSSLGVKQAGHKADYPPPSSTEVKNVWSYISTPPYVFSYAQEVLLIALLH
jgi:hypothetical protein